MKIIPLFGASTAGKSYVVTRQRRLNVYYDVRPDKDKTKIVVYGTPAMDSSTKSGIGVFRINAPAFPPRALLGCSDNFYAVIYNQLWIVTANFTTIVSAGVNLLNTLSGNVSIINSASQVVIADGLNGYLYTPATGVFATIGSNFPNGAKTVAFVAGFFVAEQPGSQKFWVSNAFDGSTWNALAFASISSDSDNILAVDHLKNNLILFGETHGEFWQNQGTTPQPFAPILSAAFNVGLAAIWSRQEVGDSLCFLGQTKNGQVQVFRITGYQVQPMSDADIDYIINSFTTVSDATACSYQIDSHKFYQINFPTQNRSFLFDLTTGIASEVQSGASVTPVRHWANLSAEVGGVTVLSDYFSAQLYTMNQNLYRDGGTAGVDNGTVIAREVITRHLLSNFNRVRISMLYLDMETGVGLQTGQGTNPQIMLSYSKDNGRTWSAERWVSSGLVGNYIARVLWRRFGSTRDATFKIRMTDPVKFVITEGAIKIRERKQ